MTLFITLTTAQADTGPFNLFSNVDGYVSAMASNVTKAQLLAGYSIPNAPDGTTIVRVRSIGICKTSVDLIVGAVVTTTTTAPPPPPEITTTTSTTSLPVTTTTTTTQPVLTAR